MRAVLLLSLALFGCATDAADPTTTNTTTAAATAEGGTVQLRTISSGGYAAAQPERPTTVVIRTAEEYASKWEQTVGGGGQPPSVDFATESVVILLAGSKPTGGWSVEPRGARLEGSTLVIDAAVKGPPPDSMVTQAFTSPYAAVAVSAKNFQDVSWKP